MAERKESYQSVFRESEMGREEFLLKLLWVLANKPENVQHLIDDIATIHLTEYTATKKDILILEKKVATMLESLKKHEMRNTKE